MLYSLISKKLLTKFPIIQKLIAHGIDGLVVKWVESWLEDRKQRVCLNGARSDWRSVLSGVPQGSILGPLLFLIFINDLEFGILNSLFKFADDTKVLGRAASGEDCLKLQKDLDGSDK